MKATIGEEAFLLVEWVSQAWLSIVKGSKGFSAYDGGHLGRFTAPNQAPRACIINAQVVKEGVVLKQVVLLFGPYCSKGPLHFTIFVERGR